MRDSLLEFKFCNYEVYHTFFINTINSPQFNKKITHAKLTVYSLTFMGKIAILYALQCNKTIRVSGDFMREKFYRFMAGRNGVDHFCRFLSYAALAAFIANIIFRSSILWTVALVLIIYCDYRMLSRNLPKRRAENARYLQLRSKITNDFQNWRDRQRQRKDFCFFRCPSCRAMLRVPRGKGKIRVTCRKCGNAFEKRT